MLKAKLYATIHEIDETQWNSLLDAEDLYHRHEFVSIIEDAQIENSDFWYLLVYENDQLTATVCLSAFEMSLDLLMVGDRKWIGIVRKIWPKFLKVNILICGLPISLGQKNIKIKAGSDTEGILQLVTEKMLSIARERRIYHLCYKEFNENETASFHSLSQQSFFKAFSLPYIEMDIKWKTFSSYLTNLRHPYRRKIKKGLGKLNILNPEISFNKCELGLTLNNLSANSARQFYRQYLSVMERAKSKLETLNMAFFELFFDRYQGKFDLLQVKNGEEVLSSGILLKEGDVLHFMLIGLPQFKNEKYDPYFNLLYAIVQFAINNGCRKIKLGQTAYWVKQQIGGTPRNVFLYYFCRKKIIHFLLKRLNLIVFPQTIIKPVNVFNNVNVIKTKTSRYEFAE